MFAANIGEVSLTPRQFEVLKAVSLSDEPSQTLLVELTGIDRSTLADIVRRLVERNLLKRKRTRHDARMYAVTLSGEGQAALKAAEPVVSEINERLAAGLTKREREALVAALSRIVSSATAQV